MISEHSTNTNKKV